MSLVLAPMVATLPTYNCVCVVFSDRVVSAFPCADYCSLGGTEIVTQAVIMSLFLRIA